MPAFREVGAMKQSLFYGSMLAAFCMVLCSCTRTTVVDVAAEDETSVLFAAISVWPEDTTGGISAVGTAKPTPSQSDPAKLEAQAEYGALMRLLGEFRKPERLGLQVSQPVFFDCIETNIAHIHVKRETLPNKNVQVGIFIAAKSIDTFMTCLRK